MSQEFPMSDQWHEKNRINDITCIMESLNRQSLTKLQTYAELLLSEQEDNIQDTPEEINESPSDEPTYSDDAAAGEHDIEVGIISRSGLNKKKPDVCRECGGEYKFSQYCGVDVCERCGYHKNLARCFCGWNLRPGERLEDDIDC